MAHKVEIDNGRPKPRDEQDERKDRDEGPFAARLTVKIKGRDRYV